MIITVFITGASEQDQWQAEMLEHSWWQSGQEGELLRLVACPSNQILPVHSLARVRRTMPWDPHPFTQDNYAQYNKPAALMEWLLSENIEATLLLLDSNSVLLAPVKEEIHPGEAIADTWKNIPVDGSGPFGLNRFFRNVQAYTVNRKLTLPRARFPLIIHSSDVKKIAPRWLEMTGLIRSTIDHENPKDAERLAYTIAAAEFGILHKTRKLANSTDDRKSDKTIIRYRKRIKGKKNTTAWDRTSYQPWEECFPENALAGAGREFLSFLQEFTTSFSSGQRLAMFRPIRVEGVREARVIGQMILDLPDNDEGLSLNSSASAIWKLINDEHSMLDIATQLEQHYSLASGTLWPDVEATMAHLRSQGAIRLEAVPEAQISVGTGD